jgi:thioredoxin-like negative regulator of GroEL
VRARIFLILLPLLLGALLAGIVLAPNREEMALMQLGDLDFNESLKMFDDLHARGDNSITVISPLVNLHLHYGNVDEAIGLLETFVANKPRDVEGRKWLAELYKASQRYYEYCRVLEELQHLAPSTGPLRELADTYDFLGEYKAETNALARLIDRSDYEPHEDDYVKLATFYRVRNKPKDAIGVMEDLLDRRNYKISFGTVYLAVQLYLENGNESDAFEIADSFLKHRPLEKNAIKFSELFQLNGKVDLAYKLLIPYLSNAENSPELEQQMVGLLFAQKKFDGVFDLLSAQFAKNKLPDALAATLIDLAQNRNDYGLMEAVLRKTALDEIPEEALLRYAGTCIRLKRRDLAQLMESRISAGNLTNDMPLLAAILRIAIEDTPEAMSALTALPSNSIVSTEQRLMVASVFVTHGQTKRARDLLDDIPVADVLTMLDAVQYALLYLEDEEPGATAKAEQQLRQIQRDKISAELRFAVEKAGLLIEVGRGDIASVETWFKEHPKQNTELYAEAFDIAERTHHEKLAVNFAERLYRVEPTENHREALIDALVAYRHYPEALTYLQQEIGANPKAKISAYADILSQWSHSSIDLGKERAQLQPYVDFMLRHSGSDRKEIREIAYLLQEMGFRQEAEGLFVNLAIGQPFSSKEVEEILAFWGNDPSPQALAWTGNQAATATGMEKVRWLSHLNEINHPEVVIAVVNGHIENAPSTLVDAYIDALVATHSPKLRETLAGEIEDETDVARLKRLVKLAEQEDIRSVPEKGWRKVHALDPDDADALKSVALQEAGANHYSAALPLLQRYLKDNSDDYQINYAYAGILQHNQNKSEAKPYYDKAYNQLIELKEKTPFDQISEAHLLYLSKGLAESKALFRELIDKYPDNKALRADFAEILIENKQYDEASVVLSR